MDFSVSETEQCTWISIPKFERLATQIIPLCFRLRGIVYPGDIGKFDGLVSQHELKAYAELTHKQQKTDENEASKTRDGQETANFEMLQKLRCAEHQRATNCVFPADIRLNKRTRSASDTVGQDVKPREGERFVELRRRRHSLGTDVDLDTSQEVSELLVPIDARRWE